MTSRRNLGPILALGGGALAVAAIVAGFLLVGGPGDARDRRLDEMTEDRIADAVRMAQCAYYISGTAPAALENARAAADDSSLRGLQIVCNRYNEVSGRDRARTAAQPESPGDVTYQALGGASIRVCGSFRRAYSAAKNERQSSGRGDVLALFPALLEDRPAPGVHCYDLELRSPPTPKADF